MISENYVRIMVIYYPFIDYGKSGGNSRHYMLALHKYNYMF